ncbi:hypothetical protein GQ44DRAFT_792468 [Phaeosphaeriaceae sp. PMI808]|nr:hypothetical protein GQ44DRAFT_792468 [Phaeosphaeriaceae sp. PMI808]
MRFNIPLAQLLPLISFAIAAPTSAPSDDLSLPAVIEGPFPFEFNTTTDQPPSDGENDTIHILANCNGGGDINTADIEALANSLQNSNVNNYLPKQSGLYWTRGSTRVCVRNNYIFENTHVSNWEVGWGAKSVRNACCFNQFCGGGSETGHGDSGLAVSIRVTSAGVSC